MQKDKINLVCSQRLIELLNNSKHEISKTLLECVNCKSSSAISYLDFGSTDDTISFIYSNKFCELVNQSEREGNDSWKEKVWFEKRSDMKVGKVIKLIFDEMFPINQVKEGRKPSIPNDIESFVNLYKAERNSNQNYEKFEIVKGEDIVKWYSFESYSRFAYEDTPLGKSCMRYKDSGKFLEMYVKNSDLINMIILKDDLNKLKGRAILWNLTTPEGRRYMDRIYTVNDYDIHIFKNYASQNGWLYKERQTFGWNNIICDPVNNEKYTFDKLLLSVQLYDFKLKYYPYLDTMSIFNTKTGLICNNGILAKKVDHILLTDYQGGYIDEVETREMVYSIIYNRDIAREDAIFCEIDDSWVYVNEAVYVYNTEGKKAFRNSLLIVRCEMFNMVKHFLKTDCVVSEYMLTYIYRDSARKVYFDREKTQTVIVHVKLLDLFFEKDNCGDYVKVKNVDYRDSKSWIRLENEFKHLNINKSKLEEILYKLNYEHSLIASESKSFRNLSILDSVMNDTYKTDSSEELYNRYIEHELSNFQIRNAGPRRVRPEDIDGGDRPVRRVDIGGRTPADNGGRTPTPTSVFGMTSPDPNGQIRTRTYTMSGNSQRSRRNTTVNVPNDELRPSLVDTDNIFTTLRILDISEPNIRDGKYRKNSTGWKNTGSWYADIETIRSWDDFVRSQQQITGVEAVNIEINEPVITAIQGDPQPVQDNISEMSFFEEYLRFTKRLIN